MAYVISDDCVACGTCIDECPSGAISEGEKYSINPDACVDCGTCADVCPSGAIAPGELSRQKNSRIIKCTVVKAVHFYLLPPACPPWRIHIIIYGW